MDSVKQYDTVELRDGRTGCVVEILGDHAIYMIDVGSSPDDWETIEVPPGEVKKVIDQSNI